MVFILRRIQEYTVRYKNNSCHELSNIEQKKNEISKIASSSSAHAINEKSTSIINSNSIPKIKLFKLSTLTNKLYRFTKKS